MAAEVQREARWQPGSANNYQQSVSDIIFHLGFKMLLTGCARQLTQFAACPVCSGHEWFRGALDDSCRTVFVCEIDCWQRADKGFCFYRDAAMEFCCTSYLEIDGSGWNITETEILR